MVAVDYHTKWVEAAPLRKSPNSKQIAEFFRRSVLARTGPPKVVICDNGSEFRGEFSALFAQHNILRCPRAAYHPEGNGLAERTVQTIKDRLAKATGGHATRWVGCLDEVLYGMRTARQSTTGTQPYLAMYGREPRPWRNLALAQGPEAAEWEAEAGPSNVGAIAAGGDTPAATQPKRKREHEGHEEHEGPEAARQELNEQLEAAMADNVA